MATFPLSGGAQFPDGTSVSVYPRTAWSAEDLSGGPSGSAAGNSPQTITSGSATFTGLADATDYVAYANVGGQNRYRRFTTRVDALPSAESGPVKAELGQSVIVLGGDHPYRQWAGNGMSKAYATRGLRAYLAINSDAPGVTPGDADMLSWAQLAQVTADHHEVIAHGARHVQDWTRLNTGLLIVYTGANATATVQVSATQIIATAGAGDSVTVNLAGNTLAQVRDAINAVAGWSVTLAAELTGSEPAATLLQIAATSVKTTAVRFAAGGGITVLYAGTTYRTAFVQINGGFLKIWGDGRRLMQQAVTGAVTLNTVVAAINAVTGFSAFLCDNQKATNAAFESYLSGNELAASLANINPGTYCIGYPAILNAGLPRWYMIERQLQRNVDQAAAQGYTLRHFASSGSSFVQPLAGGHGQFGAIRGNQLNDVADASLPGAEAFPAYAHGRFHPVTALILSHYPAGSGRLPALAAALADSPGFMVDALMHKALDDGSSSYDFPSDDATYYDQTEGDFVAFLDAIKVQVDAKKVINLLPSELPAAAVQRPRNYLFNPRFRNSGEALLAINNRYSVPGWNVLTPGVNFTAASVNADGTFSITTSTAAEQYPLSQLLFLEPGKTYEIGALVTVPNYTTGAGVSLRVRTQRGWQRGDAYNTPRVARSRYATSVMEHLRMTYTVPAPEEIQKARIISQSFGAGIDMSVNKNIKLAFWGKTLDNLDLSAGAAAAASVKAVEAAAAVNSAILAAVKAGTVTDEFLNLARAENGQLIIEVPYRGPDFTFVLTVRNATAADISATVFGTTDSYSAPENGSAQDALLMPLIFEVAHALANGSTFTVARPYCQEVAVR